MIFESSVLSFSVFLFLPVELLSLVSRHVLCSNTLMQTNECLSPVSWVRMAVIPLQYVSVLYEVLHVEIAMGMQQCEYQTDFYFICLQPNKKDKTDRSVNEKCRVELSYWESECNLDIVRY